MEVKKSQESSRCRVIVILSKRLARRSITAMFKISRRSFGGLIVAGFAAVYLLRPSGSMTKGSERGQVLKERNFRLIKTNGIRLRTVVEGNGPLVILLHGFPYGWYLWRHQIDPLVEAGFQVGVPDMPGYGGSDQPEAIEAYNIIEATKDVAGLADALDQPRFIVVGQDWGAVTAWYTTLAYPQRTRAVVGMTYPFFRPDWFHRADSLPRPENFGGKFAHHLYFQKSGVAEAEFEADVPKSLRVMYYYSSGGAPGESCFGVRSSTPATGRFFDGFPDPKHLPDWLSEQEFDYAVAQWKRSGLRGALNWYRNFDRNADLTRKYQNMKLDQPSFFIGGGKELSEETPIVKGMGEWLTDLRGTLIIPGAGHSIPMERPLEVNKSLLDFLSSVK